MTKRLLLAALVLFAPFFALADGGCLHDMALQQRAVGLAVIPHATALVCTNANCTSTATLYADETLAVSVTNPVTADARGNVGFCTGAGNYWVKVTNPSDGTAYTMPSVTVASARPGNIRYADQYPGADIGAKVNAAWADCSNTCKVVIPSGTYSFSTTILYPLVNNGNSSLEIVEGATLNYTGSTCAISALDTGLNLSLNLHVFGGGYLTGNGSGTANGICLSKFSHGYISGLTITGFTTGAAIKNVGANTVEIEKTRLRGNKYGYWGVGSGDGYAPNALSFHNNLVEVNTTWGAFLDSSGDAGGGGAQQNVQIRSNVFESNGTNGNANTGHIYAETAYSPVIEDNYLEYFGGESKTISVRVGDATHTPTNPSVRNNFFVSVGTTSTIQSHSYGLRLESNQELYTNTNFFDHQTTGGFDATIYGWNLANSTNKHVGAGVANSALGVSDATGTHTFYGGINAAYQEINAVTACGVPTDKTTDAGPTIQACLDAHPGATILLPALAFAATGSTPTSYIVNQRLQLYGDGQKIVGLGPIGKRLGAVKIKFATGIGGILLPSTYAAQGVYNLFLEGSDAGASATISTYEDYSSIGAVTAMTTAGISLQGSSPTVDGVRVSSFKGHGIEVVGDSGGQPDYWKVSNSYIDFNRGFGLFVKGTDANVGKSDHLSIEGNLLGAIYDNANYGNTYDQTHATQNARNGASAGSNKAITAATGLTVASNVLTIATDVPNTWTAGQWVTTTGSTDGTFNGTCKLLTVATSSAICNFTHANGATGGGTAATSTGTQILAYYIAAGIQASPYAFPAASAGGRLMLSPYMESNQTAAVYSADTLTLNQQGAALTNVTTGHHIYAKSGPELVFKGGHWKFLPLLSSDLLIVSSLDGLSNNFTVDPSGNIVSNGTLRFGGLAPGGVAYMTLPNAKGIYFNNALANATLRGIYMHSDNILRVGDTPGTIIDTTIPVGIDKMKSGSATNRDVAGTIAISASTTGTYTFLGTYATTPICTVVPITDPTTTGVYWVTTTTTVLTVNIKTSGTITFNYTCVGRT